MGIKSVQSGKKPTIWSHNGPSDRVNPLASTRTEQTSLKLSNLQDVNRRHPGIYRTSTMKEKWNRGHFPNIPDTQETSEHQTGKLMSTASNDSFSQPQKYATSDENFKPKLLHRTLHLKIHSRFFRPNTTHRLSQHQKSQLHDKERRNSPNCR
jgi:hypothetical protein